MRWFRDNIGHGSWLALIALAVNVALSFGHVHAIGGHRSERGLIVAAVASPDSQQTPYHSDDDKADILCPICTAAAAIGTALAATPPALPLEFADVTINHAIQHVVAAPRAPSAAFQSRGPPIS
jgi:hypothetical protein